MDWLVYRVRPFRKRAKKLPQKAFHTDYIVNRTFTKYSDRKSFWDLLQFLEYIQQLSYQTDHLGDIQYRLVHFPIQGFLIYKNQSKNSHQMKKARKFFDQLQTNSLIKYFSKNYNRSLVTIPNVELYRGKQNKLMAKVWIAEELFYYAHPFLFPDFIRQKVTKHQFEVQFHVIQIFTSVNLEKTFFIRDYFQNYPSALNNSQKTEIKNYFIQLIQRLKEYDLIESNFKIF